MAQILRFFQRTKKVSDLLNAQRQAPTHVGQITDRTKFEQLDVRHQHGKPLTCPSTTL